MCKKDPVLSSSYFNLLLYIKHYWYLPFFWNESPDYRETSFLLIIFKWATVKLIKFITYNQTTSLDLFIFFFNIQTIGFKLYLEFFSEGESEHAYTSCAVFSPKQYWELVFLSSLQQYCWEVFEKLIKQDLVKHDWISPLQGRI